MLIMDAFPLSKYKSPLKMTKLLLFSPRFRPPDKPGVFKGFAFRVAVIFLREVFKLSLFQPVCCRVSL